MNAEAIHALCLMGLRAMSEYDPVEYRRTTDLSKRDIDTKIQQLLNSSKNDEVSRLYSLLTDIQTFTGTPEELNFKLRQLNSSCFQLAQHFASIYARSKDKPLSRPTSLEAIALSYPKQQSASEHDELIKLGVMLMLRELKNYQPQFEYKAPNARVDCLLVPEDSSMPHIVIEAKTYIRTNENFKQIRLQLSKTLKYWGKNTVGVILCGGVARAAKILDLLKEDTGRSRSYIIYLLIFDSRNNTLVGAQYERFKKDVIMKYAPD